MSDKSVEQTTPLKGVWVNIAGSTSTQVLRNASGEYNDTWAVISTTGGEVLNGGPKKDATYVIGADAFPTKHDWFCRAVDNPKKGDFSFAK